MPENLYCPGANAIRFLLVFRDLAAVNLKAEAAFRGTCNIAPCVVCSSFRFLPGCKAQSFAATVMVPTGIAARHMCVRLVCGLDVRPRGVWICEREQWER